MVFNQDGFPDSNFKCAGASFGSLVYEVQLNNFMFVDVYNPSTAYSYIALCPLSLLVVHGGH